MGCLRLKRGYDIISHQQKYNFRPVRRSSLPVFFPLTHLCHIAITYIYICFHSSVQSTGQTYIHRTEWACPFLCLSLSIICLSSCVTTCNYYPLPSGLAISRCYLYDQHSHQMAFLLALGTYWITSNYNATTFNTFLHRLSCGANFE